MEEGDEEAGPERQQVGRGAVGAEEAGPGSSGWAGEAAAWLGSSGLAGEQRPGWGAAAVEEGDEEARPERQR